MNELLGFLLECVHCSVGLLLSTAKDRDYKI